MSMKRKDVLIFMGSHRSNANTAYIASSIGEKLEARGVGYTFYDINRLKIEHCIDCAYCKENWGECVHDDDMNGIYDDMKHAKIVLFASPVYFNGVSSKLKTLVDRCQMIFLCDFEHKRPFVDNVDASEKKGYIVSIGGARVYENQFVGNELSLGLVFTNLRMTLARHLTYDGTDRMAVWDNPRVEVDIQMLVEEISREVMAHE